MSDNPRARAAYQALQEFRRTSLEARRPRVRIGRQDVTEDVVSLLDIITMSLDWGSDFWSDNDLQSFIRLCDLLKVEHGH